MFDIALVNVRLPESVAVMLTEADMAPGVKTATRLAAFEMVNVAPTADAALAAKVHASPVFASTHERVPTVPVDLNAEKVACVKMTSVGAMFSVYSPM